jgi:hypothetical protein
MQTETEPSELTRRFQCLIAEHAELRSRETVQVKKAVDELLPSFLVERQEWAESQRKTAEDFNLLEVMEVEGDELCHSKMLAWLLDHRIEHGTHAQGNLGFRLFLEELKTELGKEHASKLAAHSDERKYWVCREVAGDEARMDIEIAARGRFLIHLENKIHSVEGEGQTEREGRDLQARRIELAVPKEACHAFFLTLDGCKAKNHSFRPVGWNRIGKVFDRFADLAEPLEVKLFARHYAKAIKKLSLVACEEMEVEDAEV